jgi:hypothetical protein
MRLVALNQLRPWQKAKVSAPSTNDRLQKTRNDGGQFASRDLSPSSDVGLVLQGSRKSSDVSTNISSPLFRNVFLVC